MPRAHFEPTADQTFRIVATDDPKGLYDFRRTIDDSRRLERSGDIEGACSTRYEAFRRIYDLLPEDEETILDWHDEATRAAVELVNYCAIDHFLIGDWEMSAAVFELLLEIDPEDHLEATVRLAYTYIALGEFDSFDDIWSDISDKYPDKQVLALWSEWRRSGTLPKGNLTHFKSRFAPYHNEFTADDHPVTQQYLEDIGGERPSQHALARELWLQTEHLWLLFGDFIEKLRSEG